jgi:hypothetical protein
VLCACCHTDVAGSWKGACHQREERELGVGAEAWSVRSEKKCCGPGRRGSGSVAPDVGFYSGMEREHDHLAGSVARDGRRVELDGTGWTAVLM